MISNPIPAFIEIDGKTFPVKADRIHIFYDEKKHMYHIEIPEQSYEIVAETTFKYAVYSDDKPLKKVSML